MIAFLCLIAISIVWYGKCITDIPLAPYNLKLYCRNGQSHVPETRVLSLCPSSSTSCGYFEFEKTLLSGDNEKSLGIYQCIDSNILMSDNDDNEKMRQFLFSKYCNDQARCQEIMLHSFNPRFIQYLINRYNLNRNDDDDDDDDKFQQFLTKRIKFCCSINDYLLQKVINSNDYNFSTLAPSKPIICNNVHCHGLPIGCLTYSEYNRTIQSEEDDNGIFIQPVQNNSDDYTIVSSQPINNNKYMMKQTVEYHCVYRHFNDEFYRYCLLIHDQPSKNNNHCFYGDDYQICCCFLQRGAQTCDPLSVKMITSISTAEIPQILHNQSTIYLRSYNTAIKTKLRIRCRTVHEISSESQIPMNRNDGKKLICETEVINLSYRIYLCNLLLIICYLISNYFNIFINF